MSQDTMQDNSLMSLVARAWQLDAGVEEAIFDFDNKSVAFVTTTGAVAIAPAADPDAAENRARIESDVGRIMITSRTKPTMPLLKFSAPESHFVSVCPGWNGGFIAVTESGQIYSIKVDGQIDPLGEGKRGQPKALVTNGPTKAIAVLFENEICVLGSDGALLATKRLESPASDLAFSPDGKSLANADSGGVTILSISENLKEERRLAHSASHARVGWSPSGRFITTALVDSGLHTWRLADGLSVPMLDYPSPSRHFNWGPSDGFLATSGAFRIVCWPLADKDLSAKRSIPLKTGTSGIVLVTATAAQGKRNLVAGGYDNGNVVICETGKPDELLLRGVDGHAVRALAWSDDGLSLAIGTAGGFTAVARFPSYMFK